MSVHVCTVEWQRDGEGFADQRYSRAHAWRFDGGAVVPGSSSPHSVKLPYSDPAAVDPEEAFVASVSSCHMLWFLSLAAQRGYTVDRYTDAAEGLLAASAPGAPKWMTQVVLRPRIVFSGDRLPTDEALDELHHAAHAACYIANSVRSEVRVEGRWERA